MSARDLLTTVKQGLSTLTVQQRHGFFKGIHELESQETRESTDHARREALYRFAAGATVAQPSSDEELADARYLYLREKHLK